MSKLDKKQKKSYNQSLGEAKELSPTLDVVLVNPQKEQVTNLFESFSKLSTKEQSLFRISIIGVESDFTEFPPNCFQYSNDFLDTQWITKLKDEHKSTQIALIDGDYLNKKLEIKDFLKLDYQSNKLTEVTYLGQDGSQTSKGLDCIVVAVDLLMYVLESTPKGELLGRVTSFVAKRIDVPINVLKIKKNSPFKAVKKENLIKKLTQNFWWYFLLPINELRKNQLDKYTFFSEGSIYRMKFWVFAIILLIGMPIASYNSGISGDEFVQYKQGKAVLDWFINLGEVSDQNRTAVEDPKTLLHLYGSSFDLLTATFNKVFNIENEYEVRHVLNSLTGWLLILFCGLIAVNIGGFRSGLIAMFLVFISPRILGHSWSNPKDIPFAMSYMIGMYYILSYLRNLAQIKFKHILLVSMAIGLSIGIRIGGLLLFAYLFLFTGLYFLIITNGRLFKASSLKRLKPIFLSLAAIVVLGYIIGIMFWPFAIIDPITNPLESLNVMTSYGTSIRQLFEGNIVWSDYLPWYYISKYILITTPLVVWIGILFFFGLFFKFKQRMELFWKFCILFAFIFPVAYIIYKNSNVYGGWRHALFVYPPIAVCAAIGYSQIISFIKNHWVQKTALLGLILLSFHPLKHTFSNHPYQYQYFNEAVGGIDAVSSKYETDYYYHSTREAYLWLKENVDWSKYSKENPLKVATNGIYSLKYYARDEDKVKLDLFYIRYYDRGSKDWDYYICVNSYINPGQLKRNLWPPKNTDYSVMVDNTPLCAVIKRKTNKDYEGQMALNKGDNFNAIKLLTEAIKEDPMSELAYLNLAQAYMNINNNENALKATVDIMQVYPNYDKALYFRSIVFLNTGDYKKAIETSKEVLKANPKYYNSYYTMGLAYAKGGDLNSAKKSLQSCIEQKSSFKPAYQLMGQILRNEGNEADAKRYEGYANQL